MVELLIGTRKGAFLLRSDQKRKKWKLSPAMFLGHIIYHFVKDSRSSTLLIAAKTGHLGPTVFRSTDGGETWKEATTPPAFPKAEGEDGKAVENVFWLSPGHPSQPKVWYAGSSPPGVFRSEDDGVTWAPVQGFNEHPQYSEWTKVGPTPGGQLLHSILIDPGDANHMYLGISVGGVFESVDGGKNWTPMNKGCSAEFLPDPGAEYGHDPHCVVFAGSRPEVLYQQNHCGIYRIDRPSKEWHRIGKAMPQEIGDIGFPIVPHPRDADKVWVFPMDGTEVWPRTSPGGKPAVYVTADGGKSWSRKDQGLPSSDAYFTVKRQAMDCDSLPTVGVYFGTSQGEIWGSNDEGETWSCLVRYLPEVFSVQAVS